MPTQNSYTIMILGAYGQVGSDLRLHLEQYYPHTLICVGSDTLNLTELDKIIPFIVERTPDIIINCAAYTNAERAEEEPDIAEAINAHAPKKIAIACEQLNIPFIHISTDYVFGGCATAPIPPTTQPDPINVYGVTKAKGEHFIQENCTKHIIVRTSWVFGLFSHNFVKTMLRLGKKHETIRVVHDQHGSPTSAHTLVQGLIAMSRKALEEPSSSLWGMYHLSNPNPTTWHGFAQKIFAYGKEAGIPQVLKELIPIATSEFPLKAQRPSYSVMDCTKTWETFALVPNDWQEELRSVIFQLKELGIDHQNHLPPHKRTKTL